jgi:hypothetical protein
MLADAVRLAAGPATGVPGWWSAAVVRRINPAWSLVSPRWYASALPGLAQAISKLSFELLKLFESII